MYILHYKDTKTGKQKIKNIPVSCKSTLSKYIKNNKNIDKTACIYGLPVGLLNFK